jgi:hypothetical protein
MGIGAAAAGGAAGGEAGALDPDLMAPALIMRVNSPGPELTGGAAIGAGAAAGVAESRWIKRVTLPASPEDGSGGGAGVGVNEGSGSYVGAFTSCCRGFAGAREANRLVTLDGFAPGSPELWEPPKSGSFIGLNSSRGGAGLGVGGE